MTWQLVQGGSSIGQSKCKGNQGTIFYGFDYIEKELRFGNIYFDVIVELLVGIPVWSFNGIIVLL